MRTLVGGLLLATLSVFSVSAQAAATSGQEAAAAAGSKNCNEEIAKNITQRPLPVLLAIAVECELRAMSDLAAQATLGPIMAAGGDQQELLLCQLSESSTLLAQLGVLVSEGLERLIENQGIAAPEETGDNDMEKRKHEYLRFGKRKHEYLRFGKRKHEYLRFGKRKHEYLRFGRK